MTARKQTHPARHIPERAPQIRPADADWVRIRRAYEQEGTSPKALCEQFGIASLTSVSRRVVREGWTRDIGLIADRLATRSVAFHEAAQAPTRRQKTARPITIDGEQPVLIPGADAPPGRRPRKTPVKPLPLPKAPRRNGHLPPPPTPWELSTDHNTMLTVFNLAQRQAAVRAQEIAGCDVLIGLGRVIVDALMRVVDIDGDPDDIGAARRQLLALNPDKDGLGTLAKVALGLIDGGARLKRRAFAMDAKGVDAPERLKPAQPRRSWRVWGRRCCCSCARPPMRSASCPGPWQAGRWRRPRGQPRTTHRRAALSADRGDVAVRFGQHSRQGSGQGDMAWLWGLPFVDEWIEM